MNGFVHDQAKKGMGSCCDIASDIPKAHNQKESSHSIVKTCTVKWIKSTMGYGFLEASDISADIFLHASTIDKFGINVNLMPGDSVECEIKMNGHMQKPHVVKIFKCMRKNADLKSLTKETAHVKWFNVKADYGFINTGEFDIFVSGKLLRESDIVVDSFYEGLHVECDFMSVGDNKVAYTIKILHDDDQKLYA